MIDFLFKAEGIAKSFSPRKYLFENIELSINPSDILGIAGPNGSGKSTLMRILAGNIKPDKGSVQLSIDGKIISREEMHKYIGYVAPYVNLYDEFTPIEMIDCFAKLKLLNDINAEKFLTEFNLIKHKNKQVKLFSSGMKQRMKYIIALLNNPVLLFLDEPTENLDDEGVAMFQRIVETQSQRGGAVIIASNDEREKSLCHSILTITKNE